MGGWAVGWEGVENEINTISALNAVVVEIEAELGKKVCLIQWRGGASSVQVNNDLQGWFQFRTRRNTNYKFWLFYICEYKKGWELNRTKQCLLQCQPLVPVVSMKVVKYPKRTFFKQFSGHVFNYLNQQVASYVSKQVLDTDFQTHNDTQTYTDTHIHRHIYGMI